MQQGQDKSQAEPRRIERPERWRLLTDTASNGAWNMAVDEAVLEAYAGGSDHLPPTLRLYGWRPGALSLGRSQAEQGACCRRFLRREGLDLVRRPTGGAAVLHESERTYSLVGKLRVEPFGGEVLEIYRVISEALIEAFRLLGLDARTVAPSSEAPGSASFRGACYELSSAHEISVGDRKLVGSAQVRKGSAFLQHGSIPLAMAPDRLDGALGHPTDPRRYTDLDGALGRRVTPVELDRAIVAGFERRFGVRLQPGELTSQERYRAVQLRTWKYNSVAWTRGGIVGARETAWSDGGI